MAKNKPSKKTTFKDVLSGNIFTKDFFKKQYKLLLFIAGLLFVYIAFGFRGQEQQREIQRLQNEISVTNSILTDLSHEYTTLTRPSYLNEQLKKSGSKVRESETPVIKIE